MWGAGEGGELEALPVQVWWKRQHETGQDTVKAVRVEESHSRAGRSCRVGGRGDTSTPAPVWAMCPTFTGMQSTEGVTITLRVMSPAEGPRPIKHHALSRVRRVRSGNETRKRVLCYVEGSGLRRCGGQKGQQWNYLERGGLERPAGHRPVMAASEPELLRVEMADGPPDMGDPYWSSL